MDAIARVFERHAVPPEHRDRLRAAAMAAGAYGARTGPHALAFGASVVNREREVLQHAWWTEMRLTYRDCVEITRRALGVTLGNENDRAIDLIQRARVGSTDAGFAVRAECERVFEARALAELGFVAEGKAA